MKLTFWGATEGVTGSMTFLDDILIDCGLAQGLPEERKANTLSLPKPPSKIRSVVVTHAHLDHSGYLPRLVRLGFKGRIHCTPSTAKLMRLILLDSAHLSEDQFYDEKDVTETLGLIALHEQGEGFSEGDVHMSFLPAGHILGASSLSLRQNNKHVVFSGDLGRQDDPLMLPPSPCPLADAIVMESTYGDSTRTGSMEKEMADFMDKVIHGRRIGLVASFAVARGQNLLTLIHRYLEGNPSPGLGLYMDSPMMKEANLIYRQYAHLLRHPDIFHQALSRFHSIDWPKQRKALEKRVGPFLILSSSGMLSGGRIMHHLKALADDGKAILFLPGYQGEGTLGRGFLEGKRHFMCGKETINWTGEIQGSEAFSSHADQRELIDWVSRNNSSAQIFLIHGDRPAKEALKAALRMDVHLPFRGESVDI